MNIPNSLVFHYGNMRKNEGNHRLLAGSELAAEQCRTAGRLYDTGNGYPVMIPGGNGSVYGELYRVSPAILRRLNAWEGCDEDGRGRNSLRVSQPVHTDSGTVEAYVYIQSAERSGEARPIELGDWKYDRRARDGKPLLYFAYGSCMDDERFIRAGKAHLFLDMLGKGTLHGYSLKFSHQAKDGGRADMAELGGIVEGKVYRIGQEALEYLKRREGVHSGVYRPAFVDIRMGRRTVKDALTFLVIRKSEREVPPPKHYETEIRRGGLTVWSEEYGRSFERHLQSLFGGSDGQSR
ncbi:gamma-glutamylcyclotransferase [Cohnella sp. AR92]|uniref:gamma-glutamylcyclotransferase n=1 Tax=Cohnella sp. AR92 TaxID=648716 RepID=UPI000F8C7FD7|nr:gamma-glutamylcyclotransferase family protein [Cohnella sp. AR92]RUS42637.1 gamma-glutamylcyclotransferase [Cohnella sp. AR92]